MLAVTVMLPTAGMAGQDVSAFVPTNLLQAAQANPDRTFDVIVVGTKDTPGSEVASRTANENGKIKKSFRSVNGAAATVTGKDLLKLARDSHVLSITADTKLRPAAYENGEMWRQSTHVDQVWNVTDPLTGLVVGPAPQAPAIAIVDSGVDATKTADFGSRVVASVNFSSLAPLATGDGEGHGTMVAAIAAGASPTYRGVSPTSPIVDLRTADAKGQSVTSDVISAIDWILANRTTYNIRVANFSMAGSTGSTFRFDPLDRAIEKLWFAGVVVVAAAGNHGSGTGAVNMSVAPGNDPFIITVGAVDQHQTADPLNDTAAPWSAYGFTSDGFSKPEVSAPGRYIISAIPPASTIVTTVPDRVVAPGYIWMSGTSFAAPVVAGTAAQLLARHPAWGPDEVKGALMLTSAYLPAAVGNSAGVGEIDANSAATLDILPPNPNENFYAFVETDPLTGQRTFNQANWATAVQSNANWTSANWTSANWASASWSSANWASASWSSANWTSSVNSMMGSATTFSESTFSE